MVRSLRCLLSVLRQHLRVEIEHLCTPAQPVARLLPTTRDCICRGGSRGGGGSTPSPLPKMSDPGSAGTNLNVEGHTSGTERNNFLLLCPSTFLALRVKLVVLLSAFVMVSAVWSISCLLFFYSRCPRAQTFVKVGRQASSVPHEVYATF